MSHRAKQAKKQALKDMQESGLYVYEYLEQDTNFKTKLEIPEKPVFYIRKIGNGE